MKDIENSVTVSVHDIPIQNPCKVTLPVGKIIGAHKFKARNSHEGIRVSVMREIDCMYKDVYFEVVIGTSKIKNIASLGDFIGHFNVNDNDIHLFIRLWSN